MDHFRRSLLTDYIFTWCTLRVGDRVRAKEADLIEFTVWR
jgi:hypothetical protein